MFARQRVSANDLRANEGRETKALNCKPITNLKEKSELSNYCKPAALFCTLLADARSRWFCTNWQLNFLASM
jgi:hypothetical protein